jgi:hypothetical protein
MLTASTGGMGMPAKGHRVFDYAALARLAPRTGCALMRLERTILPASFTTRTSPPPSRRT